MLRWKKGRQNTGYELLTLFSFKLPFHFLNGLDCHVIRYKPGDFIPEHTDNVSTGQKHFRINIVLKQCKGGEFICPEAKRYFFNRILFFRPDIMKHSVSLCEGTRLVLSIGWVKVK
jgi:hypothetical protein